MEQGFIDILKQLVKEQADVLTDAKKCKALLSDYTKNEYRKESKWLLQAVEAGVVKAINRADDLEPCKKAQIREMEEEYGLNPAVAEDIVNTLALVLRKDKTITKSPTAGKAASDNFAHDQFTGKRKITYAQGYVYEGDWVNGVPHGKGKKTFPSGIVYEGDFVQGKRSGKGKVILVNGDIYTGDFVNDKIHGKGKYVSKNGDVYEGDFVDGVRKGKGKHTSANGNVYEGDFINDERTGKGKYVFKNGDVYEGDFVNNERSGKGKLTYANGTVKQGNWVNGEFINPPSSNTTSPTPPRPSPPPYFPPPPRPRPQKRGNPIFTIVDRDSGDGSTFIFGVLGGVLGLFIGSLIGGWIGAIIGAIFGWVLISRLIGEIVHINIGKVVLIVAIGIGIIYTVIFLINAISSIPKPKPKPAEISTAVETITAIVNVDALNLRDLPSVNSAIIKVLKKGDTLNVTGELNNGWAPVTHDTDTGWVSAEMINMNGSATQTQNSPQGSSSQQVSTPPPAPIVPVKEGRYFIRPRIQAKADGVPIDLWLDRIEVKGQNFMAFYTGSPEGKGGDGRFQLFWYNPEHIKLESRNGDGKKYSVVSVDEDDDSSNPYSTNGFSNTFQGVAGTRFKITSTWPDMIWSFDEFVLGEPE